MSTKVADIKQWDGFKEGKWQESVDVRDFIQNNYDLYEGDESFLAEATDATKQLWDQVMELNRKEFEAGGVLDMDTEVVSTITSHGAAYLNKELETIVGFQTDKPFKRSFQPFGGIRMAELSAEAYGYEIDSEMSHIFRDYRKTHNDGVFSAYTPEMREVRRSGVITGLPDAYGRGRIIGDYRRVALYGLDFLIEDKKREHSTYGNGKMTEAVIRQREELSEQIKSLKELIELGRIYGYDLSRPAETAQEAFQWTY